MASEVVERHKRSRNENISPGERYFTAQTLYLILSYPEIHKTPVFQECVNLGGPMRNTMTKILTDPELYRYLTEETSEDLFNEQETNEGREEQRELGRNALRSLFYHNIVNLDWRTKSEFQRDLLALLDKKLINAFDYEMKDTEEYMR